MPDELTLKLQRLRERAANRPGDPVARAELCVALLGTSEGGACLTRTTELIDTALRLGERAQARRACEVLWEATGDARWAVLAAEGALLDGATDDGRRRLEALAKWSPELAAPRTRLAALALGEGDVAGALGWVEPVATSGPDARALYTQALLAADRRDEALDFARESVATHPDAAELHVGLGLALLAAERPDDAVDAFSEALRIDPDRPEVHYDLAVAFALGGSVPAALGVVDAALAARPGDERMTALREQLLAQLRGSG